LTLKKVHIRYKRPNDVRQPNSANISISFLTRYDDMLVVSDLISTITIINTDRYIHIILHLMPMISYLLWLSSHSLSLSRLFLLSYEFCDCSMRNYFCSSAFVDLISIYWFYVWIHDEKTTSSLTCTKKIIPMGKVSLCIFFSFITEYKCTLINEEKNKTTDKLNLSSTM